MLRFALRNLWRDLKSGELSVLLLALSVAVLSLTAVGFFTSRISQGVRAQAAEVLAADLRLESPNLISERYFSEARARGLRSARLLSFPTAIFRGRREPTGGAQRGETPPTRCAAACALRTHPSGWRAAPTACPGRGEVWIDARIIAQLKLALGDSLKIGTASFRVAQVLDYRPDQGNRVRQSRARRADQLRRRGIDPVDSAGSRGDLLRSVRGRPGGGRPHSANIWCRTRRRAKRLREVDESSRQLNSAIDRASRFLNLAGLGIGASRRGGRGHGRQAICGAPYRHRGLDEVHWGRRRRSYFRSPSSN